MANKLLIITFTIPYPASDGGKISVFGSIEYLRMFFDITLVLRAYTEENLNNIELLKRIWDNVDIEVINYYEAPNKVKKKGVGSLFIYKLRKIKYKLFTSTSSSQLEKRSFNVNISNEFTLLDRKFISEFEKVLYSKDFDIIQIEHTEYLSLVNVLPPRPLKVFVEVESRNSLVIDYLRLEGVNNLFSEYLIRNTQHLEFEYMRRYDMIFALSESDVKRISSYLPDKKVELSPFCVLDEHIRCLADIELSFEKLVFMGSENHYPNKDALDWFISAILPKILPQKQVELYITGKWSEEFKEKYATQKNICFTGFLEDVNALLDKSIMIVPIRIGGGGLRAKILQAMAFGIPIVSTSLGCDGVGGETEKDLLIADSETEFATSVIRILGDMELAKKLIINSRKLIDEKYTMKKTGEKRLRIYKTLLKSIDFV